MIRPFDLRHIWLVRDLQRVTTALDLRAALVEAQSPLRSALRDYFPTRVARTYTYVLQAPGNGRELRGFVQARARPAEAAWTITFIAPKLDGPEEFATIWYRMLLHTCIAAGEKQVQRLFACAPEEQLAEEVLRQAGFAVYARQRLFVREPSIPITKRLSDGARAFRPEDSLSVTRFLQRLTPRVIQQTAELKGPIEASGHDATTTATSQAFVWRDQVGDLSGYLWLDIGPRGIWIRIIADPNYRQQIPEMLEHALALASGHTPRPAYCAVRDYESGMQYPLEQNGFALLDTHRLWVKHTTVQVKAWRPRLAQALENRAGVAPTVSRSDRT